MTVFFIWCWLSWRPTLAAATQIICCQCVKINLVTNSVISFCGWMASIITLVEVDPSHPLNRPILIGSCYLKRICIKLYRCDILSLDFVFNWPFQLLSWVESSSEIFELMVGGLLISDFKQTEVRIHRVSLRFVWLLYCGSDILIL